MTTKNRPPCPERGCVFGSPCPVHNAGLDDRLRPLDREMRRRPNSEPDRKKTRS